jgi:hypothetical protein
MIAPFIAVTVRGFDAIAIVPTVRRMPRKARADSGLPGGAISSRARNHGQLGSITGRSGRPDKARAAARPRERPRIAYAPLGSDLPTEAGAEARPLKRYRMRRPHAQGALNSGLKLRAAT